MSNASSDPSLITPPATPSLKSVVPWSPVVALIFVVALYYVTQIIAAVVVSIAGSNKPESWLETSIYAQFFFVLIAEVLSLLALYQFLRFYKQGWKAIGFRKPKWSDLGAGLLILPLYFACYLAIASVVGWLVPSIDVDQQQQLGFDPVGTWELVLTFASLVILPPLVEEILMRGFLYTSLKKVFPILGAALMTSLVFAVAHLQFGSGAPLLWIAAIDTFVLSLFLIWLREKTGSLWASITLHALKNTVAYVSLFILHLA